MARDKSFLKVLFLGLTKSLEEISTVSPLARSLSEGGQLLISCPQDNRVLAHSNDFVKPNEQSKPCFSFAMARTFVQASAEPNLFGLCRAQSKVSEENRTFKNGLRTDGSLHKVMFVKVMRD